MAKLRSLAPDQPKLAAVPFDEGTVQCIALNLQGSGDTTASPALTGAFNAVEKILGATTPSLDATNTATFSLVLSQEGAIIIEKAFEQGTTPVGVLYNLKYTGLRPALEVKITADLKRVYNHFSASLTGQYYFFKLGIEAGLEKLVQEGAIKIEVINYSNATDRAEKENWALDFFKEKLLKDWFEPTLTPGELAGGGIPNSNPNPNPSPNPNPNPNPTSGGGGTPTLIIKSNRGNALDAPSSYKPATLEILSREPNPSPDGYTIEHIPATTGTTETIAVRGGTNPIVRVNGNTRSLPMVNSLSNRLGRDRLH